jgi:hypothetical protein
MPRTAPIGRDEELGSLVEAARTAAAGRARPSFSTGRPAAASRSSSRASAAAVVRAKAASLEDQAQRESFLTRVRLSRDVLAAR